MNLRRLLALSASLFFLALCTACGGSSGGSTSAGGGGTVGGGNPGPSITASSPSTVMERGPIPATDFLFYLFGQNFTQQSEVFVDGQPASSTTFLSSTTLKAEYTFATSTVIGTHQLTVNDGSNTSNSSSFTAYWPQQGPLVMQAIPSYFVALEDAPTFFAVADFNGDGLADAILPGDTDTANAVIMYGQSDGSLVAGPPVVGVTPWSLISGDVDGNGTADLIGGNFDQTAGTCTVSVWLGDGHGNFQAPSTSPPFPGIYPGPAQLVDIDGDGLPDLVVSIEQATGVSTSILWLKNEGGGNFAGAQTLAQATSSTSFSVADLNGDGKPDILYWFYDLSTNVRAIHTLINLGGGKFTDEATPGLSGISIGVMNVLDFNLDGFQDVVVQVGQNGSGVVITSYSGNGDGSFTQAASLTLSTPTAYGPFILVPGDFDHDGLPDLAGGDAESEPSHIIYLYGDGRGNFTPQELVGPRSYFVGSGDVNGDGIPDLILPDEFRFISVALGRTNRTFQTPLALTPATVTGVSAGDINGDGLPEILVGGDQIHGIPSTIFLNNGNSSFQFGASVDPSAFELADLTGKGVSDLLGGYSTTLYIWPNNGTLSFSSSPVTVPQVTFATVADMDHDGYPDVVSTGEVFYGNGAYQFTPAMTDPSFAEPYAVGDFNGDGLLDIGTNTYTFENVGNRMFQTVRDGNRVLPLGNEFIAAVADFNGDGCADVALIGPGYQGVEVYYAYGDGTFYYGAQLDAGQVIGDIAVGDFNGDGLPDIAAGLLSSQQVAVFLNSGNGQYTRAFYASGAQGNGLIAADLNKNGKSDLVIGNFELDSRPPNVDVVFHK